MSVIMKYSNNITRAFVIGLSMIFTSVLSVVIFGILLNFSFICACLLTISAVYLYHFSPQSPVKKSNLSSKV